MAAEQSSALVLKDDSGNYFLISLEALEQGRVPEEKKAALEQLIAASEVSGYSINSDAGKLANVIVQAIVFGLETLNSPGVGAAVSAGADAGRQARVQATEM